jgi:hypothetical protein
VTAFVRAERTLGVAVAPTVGNVDRAVAAACPELAGAPLTVDGGRRTSVVDRYLDPARSRPNLTVRAATPVERVLLDGTRAVGAELTGGEVVEAAEVVVSAGAIHSPALLARSGVEREGIGANLRDHPAVGITVTLDDPAPGGLPITAAAALSSGREPVDLQILPINRLSAGVGMVMVALMKVLSCGRVTATSVGTAVELDSCPTRAMPAPSTPASTGCLPSSTGRGPGSARRSFPTSCAIRPAGPSGCGRIWAPTCTPPARAAWAA